MEEKIDYPYPRFSIFEKEIAGQKKITLRRGQIISCAMPPLRSSLGYPLSKNIRK